MAKRGKGPAGPTGRDGDEEHPDFDRMQQDQLLAYARDLSTTFAQLRAAQTRLHGVYLSTLTAMAAAIEARDPYLVGHSRAVSTFASRVGVEMGLPSGQLVTLQRAALLHDIGKIGVADAVLKKPGPLSQEEWQQMRRHPELGYSILSSLDFLGEALDAIRHHHERYDGRGYPLGLRGNSVPLAARILAVCDSLDAMLSNRPYRSGMAGDRAAEELRQGRGTQFDPQVVDALLATLPVVE